jgi:hypothetical protein
MSLLVVVEREMVVETCVAGGSVDDGVVDAAGLRSAEQEAVTAMANPTTTTRPLELIPTNYRSHRAGP